VAGESQRAYLHEACRKGDVGSPKKKEESNPRSLEGGYSAASKVLTTPLLSLVLAMTNKFIMAVPPYEATIRYEAIYTVCIDFFFDYTHNWSVLPVGTPNIDFFYQRIL